MAEEEELAVKLSLRDRVKFKRDAEEAARLVRGIGESAHKSSRVAGAAFTAVGRGVDMLGRVVKRAVQGIAIGVAAVGTLLAKQAFDYMTTYETAEVAFTRMLGSGEKARSFLTGLENFAKESPFEMPGVIDASKRLMAYGYTAEEVVPMLTRVGDAAAGLGLGAQGIQRITTAIGQMKAKGTVQAEEMRQLAEAGIPAWQALAERIGTSIPEAMALVEKRMVPSGVAINAVMEGMDKRFSGMQAEQAKTIVGLWAKLRDTVGIEGRKAMEGLAPYIRQALRGTIAYVETVSQWFVQKAPAAIAKARDAVVLFWEAWNNRGAQGVAIHIASILGGQEGVDLMNRGIGILRDMWTIFTVGVLPAFKDASDIIPAVLQPMKLIPGTLDLMADNAETLRPIIGGLIGAWMAFRGAMIAVTAAEKAHAAVTWLNTVRMAALGKATAATTKMTTAQKVATMLASGAMTIFNAIVSMNPIMLLVIAIAALVAGFIWAYKNVEWFRDGVNAAFSKIKEWVGIAINWIKENWDLVLAGMFGPVGLFVRWVIQNWETIKTAAAEVGKFLLNAFTSPIRGIISAWNALDFQVGPFTVPDWVPKFGGRTFVIHDLFPDVPEIPKLHSGGRTTSGGTAIIKPGEEAVVLPPAASVEPLPVGGADGYGISTGPDVVQVTLDGRVIAEVVLADIQDRAARR